MLRSSKKVDAFDFKIFTRVHGKNIKPVCFHQLSKGPLKNAISDGMDNIDYCSLNIQTNM